MTITEYYAERIAFGKRVRDLRQKQGITQASLAKILGLGQATTICNIEKGRRLVGIDELPQLAKALHCTMEELLGPETERSRGYPLDRTGS